MNNGLSRRCLLWKVSLPADLLRKVYGWQHNPAVHVDERNDVQALDERVGGPDLHSKAVHAGLQVLGGRSPGGNPDGCGRSDRAGELSGHFSQ